ncbi:MAG: threonine/serine exporter family protein, partial [Candidatus Xenobia bacterium]
LQCGAETSRVEETVVRMGATMGFPEVEVFCTPTGIMVSLVRGDDAYTRLVTIERRGNDLAKVAQVNALSRQMENGQLDVSTAMIQMAEIEDNPPSYPWWLRLLARGASCAAWAAIINGDPRALLPALLAGFFVALVMDRASEVLPDFLAVFTGAFVGTGWAVIAVRIGLAPSLRDVVTGVILPLVPGVALTNAVRDLIAGDLVSGVARGAEALLKAIGIAAGVWAILAAMKATL